MTDRELDALVAEKVMGWTSAKVPRENVMDKTVPMEQPIPCYSTDIAAAWRVLKQVREKFNYCGWVFAGSSEGDGWTLILHTQERGYPGDIMGSVTGGEYRRSHKDVYAPEAYTICKSALIAFGVEIPA